MSLLSFKITSDHFLLCVFLSLLWGVTDTAADSVTANSTEADPKEVMSIAPSTTLTTTTPTTTKAPPEKVTDVKAVAQNETSITLRWTKVDNIATYFLQIYLKDSLREDFIDEALGPSITYVVTPLTAGRKYNFTLITSSDGLNSTGYEFQAVTAPTNAKEFTSDGQNETSITLQWKKVGDILHYRLVFNRQERNLTLSVGPKTGTHTVLDLTAMTEYIFTLYTVFQNVSSSGVTFTAYTAPPNPEEFKSIGQNETSITLKWKQVDGIHTYTLASSKGDINITASEGLERIYTVPMLESGTSYDFTLYSLFENVHSSGKFLSAVTAPENVKEVKVLAQNESSVTLKWDKVKDISTYFLRYENREDKINKPEGAAVTHEVSLPFAGREYDFSLITAFRSVNSTGFAFKGVTAPRNTKVFTSDGQNETSITLQWNKVGDILDYRLVFNRQERDLTLSVGQETGTHTVSGLTAMTEYTFTLYTVFKNVSSSGANTTAYTAPLNAEDFKSIGQNETSITLQWKQVEKIHRYLLVFNGTEINVPALAGQGQVIHTIPGLTSGTKYDFTLYSLFEGVRSSGRHLTGVTAPRNTDEFKAVDQNETSITLRWEKVDNILNYTLVFNGSEIDVYQATHTVSGLTSGRKYEFSLFTVFEGVKSSGVKRTAVTAPRNTDELESVARNESSITLQWKKVNDFLVYVLVFNESEISVSATAGLEKVTHTILKLTSGTKYNFSLFTVFENVKSSGINDAAVTAPGNVNNVTVLTQNESSITLMWDKVKDISTYLLQYDDDGGPVNVEAFYRDASVTYEVSPLNAGTKYNFTLFTQFEKVNSTGFSFNAVTVPPAVALVNVTECSMTSITLMWLNVNKEWSYSLQITEGDVQDHPDTDAGVVSRSVTSLKPGTKYPFSVFTMFSGLNSTAHMGFAVTAVDCTRVAWRVTTSSIQGQVEGLFTNATARNGSHTHVSHGGSNVSFSGLYPGETYEVSLVYETGSTCSPRCSHSLTIIPQGIQSAHCENYAAGYSVSIVWEKPEGVWTSVEVNVEGELHVVPQSDGQNLIVSGFQPAKKYEVSLTSLSGVVKSQKPLVFQCATDPRGVIAGAVCAVLLFALLVCLAIFIFLKRPDIISRQKSFIGGSKQSNKKFKSISVAKFPDHFHHLSMDENRGFTQEYESLSPVGTEQTRKAAMLPENKPRNRFNNVQPYDWCRVKLSTSGSVGTSDYINASYMPGYNGNREFIASQGPLPSTVDDFWRMIWEQRVKGIVMVTNCTEGGKTKCERYWPADSKPCSHGELLVTIRSEQQEPNWTLREFTVKNRNNSEERTVTHFHFTAWPDHGVPQGTEVLIQFRSLVRQHMEREGSRTPTVVHCSAGVGRTGTFIALDTLLQQLEREKGVGINGFVYKMRLNRPYMVQTESQYVFLHQCIMDSLQSREKMEENIYENQEMIYANATALREFHTNA